MKYETPELTALTPAINTIQATSSKPQHYAVDGTVDNEGIPGYQDWES
ncbi:MAG: hypothetical protein ABSA54_00515 [Terriglobales bacterium]|jgi:hypothetical protein